MAVLEQGLFSGAALDAFREDPLSVDNPLWARKVVVVEEGSSGSGRVEENSGHYHASRSCHTGVRG